MWPAKFFHLHGNVGKHVPSPSTLFGCTWVTMHNSPWTQDCENNLVRSSSHKISSEMNLPGPWCPNPSSHTIEPNKSPHTKSWVPTLETFNDKEPTVMPKKANKIKQLLRKIHNISLELVVFWQGIGFCCSSVLFVFNATFNTYYNLNCVWHPHWYLWKLKQVYKNMPLNSYWQSKDLRTLCTEEAIYIPVSTGSLQQPRSVQPTGKRQSLGGGVVTTRGIC